MALIHGSVHGTKILVSMCLMTVQTSMELEKVLFLKGGGWSSDHHSFSMTLTVSANKIHGLMSNVGRKDVRIFWILQNGKKSNRLLPPPPNTVLT